MLAHSNEITIHLFVTVADGEATLTASTFDLYLLPPPKPEETPRIRIVRIREFGSSTRIHHSAALFEIAESGPAAPELPITRIQLRLAQHELRYSADECHPWQALLDVAISGGKLHIDLLIDGLPQAVFATPRVTITQKEITSAC